jgi:acyl-CoA synthetase (AMP-forming)/AMP-acid ligase II
MNIVEPILYQCKLNPFATAIATPGSGINAIRYGHLERLIHNVARSAIKAGLAPGDIAAIFVSDAILHTTLILGLTRIGVVTMSLTEPKLPEHIAADVIATDAPQAFAGAGKVIAINASWLQGDGVPLDYERIYRCKEDDDCRIILTSGSTGRQKGVAFTHKMLAERLAHYAYVKGPLFAKTSRLFSSLGVATSPGFRYMAFMLMRGGTVYFYGQDRTAILQYLDAYKVQSLAISPFDLDGYLKYFQADPAVESAFELIICQGARLSRELSEQARSRICQNLYTSYGSTETTTVACGPAHYISRQPGAVGFICPGVTVEIVDRDGRLLPVGHEGSIRIRSPHLARGYVGDPEATAQMFRDGAFYSGDLGFVTEESLLVVTGREKSALSVSGDTVAPEIIEEVLCSFPGVEQAAALALEDSLGISNVHALIKARPDLDEAALRAHCESKLRDVFVPVSFIRVDDIPRGGQGKIDRRRILDLGKSRVKPS